MRTTVDIPDAIYRRLKSRAASEGRTTKALILRGVRPANLAISNPMATWVDGQVVLIQPDDIVVDEEPAPSAKPDD